MQELLLKMAGEYGFPEGRLIAINQEGLDDHKKPALLLIWPYQLSTAHGEAAISSYYFASQQAYISLLALEEALNKAGIPCHRNDGVRLKPLALISGLGVLGRSSLVIHERYGTLIVLNALVIDADVSCMDAQPVKNCVDCGNCRRNCPAQALDTFGIIDRQRCLRNAMLSSSVPYPTWQREIAGSRLVGCDQCMLACPANRGRIIDALDEREPPLRALVERDPAVYKQIKKDIGTNFGRATRVLAQSLIIAGNSGDKAYMEMAKELLEHENEVVREHAAWCVQRLQSL